MRSSSRAASRAATGFERLALLAAKPVVGVDIGGTDIKAGLFDADGEAVELVSEPTPLGSSAALVDALAASVTRLAAAHPDVAPAAVGVLAPGLVDDRRGVLLRAENLALTDVPLRARLAAATGLPVALGNDARGAGYAEFRMGAGRGLHDVVVVSIGTGIGAAVFLDGASYDADGYGSEIGHMRMIPPGSRDGTRCACGGFGCLETYSSAGGIARAYALATGSPPQGAREVFDAARAGDPVAIAVRDRAIDMLALAFAQLAASLAPQAIVVAGGLSHAGDEIFVPLRERLDSMLTFHRRPTLMAARFGGNAGIIGSALQADRLLAG